MCLSFEKQLTHFFVILRMEIKAVIFDFGNVIINIDFNRIYQTFAQLTGKSPEFVAQKISEYDLFRKYETGQFSDDEFREIIRQTIGFPLSNAEVDFAWNAILLDIPQNRIQLLKDLRRKYPVFLLSNTNNIHILASNAYLKAKHDIDSIHDLFDEVFLSYKMGLWKPDVEIYQAVNQKLNLSPNQVLFLDDNPKNIESATDFGWKTILVEQTSDMTEYCRFLL